MFTDGRVTLALWTVVLAVALAQRRAQLAAVIAAAPVVAVLTERLAKQAFGRLRDDALAYPSGHTTLVVVALGLAVLVVGVSVCVAARAARS